MIADMSVAPEIARLAGAIALVPAQPAAPAGPAPSSEQAQEQPAAPLTVGTLAGRLRSIAASPERWWGLVRFEPDRAVQVTVEEGAAYRAWLVVLPPGDAGQSCDCDVATMIAGEATEGAPASAILRPGPVRVHGQQHAQQHAQQHGHQHGERHGLRGRGTGYSISLHAQARRHSTHK